MGRKNGTSAEAGGNVLYSYMDFIGAKFDILPTAEAPCGIVRGLLDMAIVTWKLVRLGLGIPSRCFTTPVKNVSYSSCCRSMRLFIYYIHGDYTLYWGGLDITLVLMHTVVGLVSHHLNINAYRHRTSVQLVLHGIRLTCQDEECQFLTNCLSWGFLLFINIIIISEKYIFLITKYRKLKNYIDLYSIWN